MVQHYDSPPASNEEFLPNTRAAENQGINFDPTAPRLGRRESEPHSNALTFLYDVLRHNFPNDRATWDITHYFSQGGEPLEIRFDVSWFQGWPFSQMLSSYRAADFQNRIPTVGFNVLSKSTYIADVGIHVDICRAIKLPLYIIFSSHPIGTSLYRPPFVRVYQLQKTGDYIVHELRKRTFIEGDTAEKIDTEALINITEIVPFRIGIMELKEKIYPDQPCYKLILFDAKEQKLLPSKLEFEKNRADTEKHRADTEKQRADLLEAELQKLKNV